MSEVTIVVVFVRLYANIALKRHVKIVQNRGQTRQSIAIKHCLVVRVNDEIHTNKIYVMSALGCCGDDAAMRFT